MDWTGVQVTLWQLSREKSLIAKRSKMKGNSGHTSKANFGSDICEFESSHPSHAVRSKPRLRAAKAKSPSKTRVWRHRYVHPSLRASSACLNKVIGADRKSSATICF